MGRIDNASKNIYYGYIANFLKILLGFISRTVFIYTLGATYLGVNGLYTNILSVLSLAELGIGTAMNYSLYKPVAENDREKIKSLMLLYKKAYHCIAAVITIIGLLLLPFLGFLIKDPGNIGTKDLSIYYLIFLFNTVSSYFIAYKYSLINAEQKNYIQTNIELITYIISTIVQLLILLIFKNFLLYLLSAAIINLIQKIYVNLYFKKLYPFLSDKNVKKLTKAEKKPIMKNVKALMYHKIGDIGVHQTDNIIISSFINVTMVGIVSNYNLIITSVSSFINIIFNSVVSGFGNLIVTENKEKQFQIFKVYRFLGFWLYGFSAIAFYELLTPFVTLWLGPKMIIPNLAIMLIIINYYFQGHRIVINNFKIAAGLFDEDKYIAFIQMVVNIVVSLALVRELGLVGVYIGTVCAGLVSTFTKPFIVYKKSFEKSAKEYYIDSLKFLFIIIISAITLDVIKALVITTLSISNFIIMFILVIIVPNLMFLICFRKRIEFKYLFQTIKCRIRRKRNEK